MTLTVTVAPAFFALTTTPSIRPSAVERTCPASASGPSWARLRELEATRISMTAKPAATPGRKVFVRMTNRLCPEGLPGCVLSGEIICPHSARFKFRAADYPNMALVGRGRQAARESLHSSSRRCSAALAAVLSMTSPAHLPERAFVRYRDANRRERRVGASSGPTSERGRASGAPGPSRSRSLDTAHGVCGFKARIIHEVPNLSLSIPKRTAKKVSSIGMNTWPPSESNA